MLGNPYALYVYCDAAMDYDSKNSGGLGFHIKFPDFINLDDVEKSIGKYEKNNIETLELRAINEAAKSLLKLSSLHAQEFRKINTVIFITDRFGLSDQNRTNAYKIREWRKNGWKNYEGKEIKNSRLLDEIDKNRKKLTQKIGAFISIEYARRKYNKSADKLAKAGKEIGMVKKTLDHRSVKVGKRIYSGESINYNLLRPGDKVIIHVFLKDHVKNSWEISAEICEGNHLGSSLRMYVRSEIERLLHRKHKYRVEIKDVFRHHMTIKDDIEEIV